MGILEKLFGAGIEEAGNGIKSALEGVGGIAKDVKTLIKGAFWLGITAPTGIVGGKKSLFAPWLGGAAATTVSVVGGYKSLLSFWCGGSFSPEAVTPPITGGGGLSVRYYYDKQKKKFEKLRQEDEEIMAVIMAFLHTKNN